MAYSVVYVPLLIFIKKPIEAVYSVSFLGALGGFLVAEFLSDIIPMNFGWQGIGFIFYLFIFGAVGFVLGLIIGAVAEWKGFKIKNIWWFIVGFILLFLLGIVIGQYNLFHVKAFEASQNISPQRY